MDLKTAFLQGEAYDETRDIICQIPPEYGYPPYIGARLKKPGYGLNDAPRWWQIIDKALLDCGLVPTRADRCTYVLYDNTSKTRTYQPPRSVNAEQESISEAIDHLMDPVARNNAQGRQPHGFICLHVDDLFMQATSSRCLSPRFCPVCVRTLRLAQRIRMTLCLQDNASNGKYMTSTDPTFL